MGNPAYDARRAAERADAEKDRAASEAAQAALEAFTAFMSGRASLQISPNALGGFGGWSIRLYRDDVKR